MNNHFLLAYIMNNLLNNGHFLGGAFEAHGRECRCKTFINIALGCTHSVEEWNMIVVAFTLQIVQYQLLVLN